MCVCVCVCVCVYYSSLMFFNYMIFPSMKFIN